MVSRDADSWLLDWLLMDKGDLSRKKEGQGVLAEGMKEQRAQHRQRLPLLCGRLVWLCPEQAEVHGGWLVKG